MKRKFKIPASGGAPGRQDSRFKIFSLIAALLILAVPVQAANIKIALPVASATLSNINKIAFQRGNTEVSLLGSAGDLTTPANTDANTPYVVTGDSYDPYLPWRAYDHALSGQAQAVTSGTSFWNKIDKGVGQKWEFSSYKITAFDNASAAVTGTIKDWTLQGSDNDSDWTTLDTQTNQTDWTANEVREFVLAATASYRYIKLVATANNGAGYTGVAEIEMFSGFSTSGETATLIEADSGATSTVWDMSTIPARANLASETGTVKYQYSCHNTASTPSWSGTWLTLAQLQGTSDPTCRYFQLKGQFNSDGTQDASLADLWITATVTTGGGQQTLMGGN